MKPAALISLLLIAAAPAAARAAAIDDDMALIPAGKFEMGSAPEEAARDGVLPQIAASQQPRHTVTIRRFLLARHDVTRGEFAAFVAETGYAPAPGCKVWYGKRSEYRPTAGWRDPGFPQTDAHPVVCVSRQDADAYIAWRSHKTGRAYRLPSAAEWEYAARAGTAGSRYWGGDLARQCLFANGASLTYAQAFPEEADVNRACADGYVFTSPAGSFRPNRWGLYDMLGDVWQWTPDCRNDSYADAPADGRVWSTGLCDSNVRRGSAWFDAPWLLRYASAKNGSPSGRDNGTGFRIARTAP